MSGNVWDRLVERLSGEVRCLVPDLPLGSHALRQLVCAEHPDRIGRYTLDAAERVRGFERPALLVWGMRDKFFPFEQAQRLAATLPQARIERVASARTFVQLDAPDRLAALVAGVHSPPART